ncbi:MAG TPA: porin [Planctomycetota bacterium]|nr:porin [Planctomycetota bacterium]
MGKWCGKAVLATLLTLGCVAGAMAVEVPTSEWEHMKQEIADLKSGKGVATIAPDMVDTKLDSKYGPDLPATTLKAPGKLKISLLAQMWYYSIQVDNRGFFSDPNNLGIVDNNTSNDINSFRVRRVETKFVYEFNECFGSVMMFDPAREANGFPNFPSNQGNYHKTGTGNGQFSAGTSTTITGGLISGNQGAVAAGSPPRLLQDAYVTCKNVVPYVDFRLGEFKWKCGYEGTVDSANLDFAERSMLGFQGDNRDLGAMAHGSFWGKDCKDVDGRFQVWAGVVDAAGSFYNPGNEQGRSDNNQSKDIDLSFLVRPLWEDCAGHLELGASYFFGRHGAQATDLTSYAAVTAASPVPPQPWASKGVAYASYQFGDWFAKGLWVRGEYGFVRDREEGSVIAFGNGNLGAGATLGQTQTALQPFSSQGGYATVGYRFDSTNWDHCVPCWLKPIEVLTRYDQFQNIHITNLANPNHQEALYTKAITAGVNYYFGERTKIQVNYNWITLPGDHSNSARSFHDTKNDSLLINFQVAY